jgi:hypothetical protein
VPEVLGNLPKYCGFSSRLHGGFSDDVAGDAAVQPIVGVEAAAAAAAAWACGLEAAVAAEAAEEAAEPAGYGTRSCSAGSTSAIVDSQLARSSAVRVVLVLCTRVYALTTTIVGRRHP